MADKVEGSEEPPVDSGANGGEGKDGLPPEHWKREKEELIKDRQSLKSKLAALEAKQKEDETNRLKETQKWQEAYNKEVPTLKTELETYKSKWTAVEEKMTARVTEKEAQLSKEAKAEYDKFISKLPLEDRDEWLNSHVEAGGGSSPASVRAGAAGGTQKPVKLMSPEERFKSFATNPVAFAKSIP